MTANFINTQKMRYTGDAMKSMETGGLDLTIDDSFLEDLNSEAPFVNRAWSNTRNKPHPPHVTTQLKHNIGRFPLTSGLARWVLDTFRDYDPPAHVRNLVQPFSAELHELFEKERASSTGFHDLNLVELVYQVSLEVGVEILVAATKNGNASDLQMAYHSSHAGQDEHFAPWGRLLTELECDPPIIAQFPFFLMMCQSFTLDTDSCRENYVNSALTGIDWIKGKNAYSDRFKSFEEHARRAVPRLDDSLSGEDRSFWRVSIAYLDAMNKAENSRGFTAPRQSYIETGMDPYLLMAARGFDTMGSAYMCTDGAAFFDNQGMDSLIGSAVPNDVMDLHVDTMTGETRNLLRLLYPNNLTIEESLETMSTVLSGMLCELFRGHKRARFCGREDGCIAAASPSYSFCRARHRRIFETMEAYITKYPQFWDWNRSIYHRARDQVTEAGLNELLIGALHRGIDQSPLPDSASNSFFDTYFHMIECGGVQFGGERPLGGVQDDLGEAIRELYHLWHDQLLASDKKPGWGRAFDEKSDAILGRAGEILHAKGRIFDDMFKFAIAYGHLSMALPYVAYHTIDAIILAYGVVCL